MNTTDQAAHWAEQADRLYREAVHRTNMQHALDLAAHELARRVLVARYQPNTIGE